MQKLSVLFLVLIISFQTANAQRKSKEHVIVVLGSSTAEGAGPKSKDSAWVNLFREYALKKNSKNTVVNLALGGYSTYHILPDSSTPVKGRAVPDKKRNITKALTLNPDIIIINMPSNDIIGGVTLDEFRQNLALLNSIAREHQIKCYITTTQARNGNEAQREGLSRMQEIIKTDYPRTYINFWSDFANADGSIKEAYNSGDGVHLNGKAHEIMLKRVKKKLKSVL
jgi:lysophospholipase L1-like esterase